MTEGHPWTFANQQHPHETLTRLHHCWAAQLLGGKGSPTEDYCKFYVPKTCQQWQHNSHGPSQKNKPFFFFFLPHMTAITPKIATGAGSETSSPQRPIRRCGVEIICHDSQEFSLYVLKESPLQMQLLYQVCSQGCRYDAFRRRWWSRPSFSTWCQVCSPRCLHGTWLQPHRPLCWALLLFMFL